MSLIEFSKLDIFDFHADNIQNVWKPAHYVAFVLRAGEQDNLYMIRSG